MNTTYFHSDQWHLCTRLKIRYKLSCISEVLEGEGISYHYSIMGIKIKVDSLIPNGVESLLNMEVGDQRL